MMKSFNLWDTSNLISVLGNFYGAAVELITSDRLCFIDFTNLLISAIGKSVKSHVSAPLINSQP